MGSVEGRGAGDNVVRYHIIGGAEQGSCDLTFIRRLFPVSVTNADYFLGGIEISRERVINMMHSRPNLHTGCQHRHPTAAPSQAAPVSTGWGQKPAAALFCPGLRFGTLHLERQKSPDDVAINGNGESRLFLEDADLEISDAKTIGGSRWGAMGVVLPPRFLLLRARNYFPPKTLATGTSVKLKLDGGD